MSYGGNPNANPNDAVRFLVGDTDESDPQLADSEISFLLSKMGGVYYAAAAAADGLAAKYGRRIDKGVGAARASFDQLFKHYTELGRMLRLEASTAGMTVFAGGVEQGDHTSRAQDDTRMQPAFTRSMWQNAGAPTTDTAGEALNGSLTDVGV